MRSAVRVRVRREKERLDRAGICCRGNINGVWRQKGTVIAQGYVIPVSSHTRSNNQKTLSRPQDPSDLYNM